MSRLLKKNLYASTCLLASWLLFSLPASAAHLCIGEELARVKYNSDTGKSLGVAAADVSPQPKYLMDKDGVKILGERGPVMKCETELYCETENGAQFYLHHTKSSFRSVEWRGSSTGEDGIVYLQIVQGTCSSFRP